ncbi:hypothetical protein CKM354_001128900 [Cercospora kikuchii]|uniref:Uncharacterized protein n=1 Tax=Cercospora kikuchii TaxID=84275 RepID=A0A9P3CSV8_9PEZI|nr:uncharacterized protein CKM354_001128900 [Cercospora kikuchii]GIZ48221.1 hypothetical protein CKM354_001128900 [Cercospora kikuchii]
MSITRYLTAVSLAAVVILAHVTLHKQFEWNGLISPDKIVGHSNRILPNTEIPIKLPETGMEGLDNYCAFIMSFFWVFLDPRNPRAFLEGKFLLSSLSSTWMIMLVEAHAGLSGSSAGFVFATYLLEMGCETIGVGLFTPIWCIVHLLITTAPRSGAEVKRFSKHKNNVRALGYALLVGHALPTVLMMHLKPDGEGIASQQLWTMLRALHPVWVFGVFKVFETLFGGQSAVDQPAEQLHLSRRNLLQFSILTSAVVHINCLTMMFGGHIFPTWVREEVLSEISVSTMFVPAPFWTGEEVSFVKGVAMFVQWDYLCSAGAMVIWAASQYWEATAIRKDRPSVRVAETLAQSVVMALVAGPGAAAAFLIQERDTVLATGVSEGRHVKEQ